MSRTLVSALIHANAALSALVSAMAAEFAGVAKTASVYTGPVALPDPMNDEEFQPDPGEEIPQREKTLAEVSAASEPVGKIRRTKEETEAGLTLEEAKEARAAGITVAQAVALKKDRSSGGEGKFTTEPAKEEPKASAVALDETEVYQEICNTIEKLVKANRTPEVVKVIGTHAGGGRSKDLARLIVAGKASMDAFKADIAALDL